MDDTAWKPSYEALVEVLDLLFERSAEPICVFGADGVYKGVNRAFCEAFGYRSEDMLSTRWLDLVHPDDVAETLAAATRMESEPLVDFVSRVRHANGTFRSFGWRASTWSQGRAVVIGTPLSS